MAPMSPEDLVVLMLMVAVFPMIVVALMDIFDGDDY
jgi:hypothetical protein